MKRHHGCTIHPGDPRIWRKGNPCLTSLVKDIMARSRKDAADYVSQGDSALTPMEVVTLRNVLLSSNNIDDFRLFVIILLCIKLFLRSNEVVSMSFSHIVSDLSVVRTGVVECIAFKVKGKTDKRPVTLSLWADNEVPSLCPIRHLLAYVHLTGLKDGFLFPGNDNGHISYDQFQSEFQSVCEMLIERPGPFGTHSGRKTAYLFAVWGGGADADIMLSARHKTINNAIKYKRDASYLLHLAHANDLNFSSIVTKWRSIFVANVQMGRKVNRNGSREFVSLAQLASNFVSKMCHCNDGGVLSTIDAIMEFQKPMSSMDEIVSMCKGHLPHHILEQLLQKIQQFTAECRLENMEPKTKNANMQQEFVVENIDSRALLPPSLPTLTVVEMAVAERTDKSNSMKRKHDERGGSNDLPDRHNIKRLRGADKILALVKLQQETPEDRSQLTEGARNFTIRTMDPILACFENHFQCNIEAFIQRWGQFSQSTFITKCCDGLKPCARQ